MGIFKKTGDPDRDVMLFPAKQEKPDVSPRPASSSEIPEGTVGEQTSERRETHTTANGQVWEIKAIFTDTSELDRLLNAIPGVAEARAAGQPVTLRSGGKVMAVLIPPEDKP